MKHPLVSGVVCLVLAVLTVIVDVYAIAGGVLGTPYGRGIIASLLFIYGFSVAGVQCLKEARVRARHGRLR